MKLRCRCGGVLSDATSSDPLIAIVTPRILDHRIRIEVSDAITDFCTKITSPPTEDQIGELLWAVSSASLEQGFTLQCPDCGRLAMYATSEADVCWFVPEDPTARPFDIE